MFIILNYLLYSQKHWNIYKQKLNSVKIFNVFSDDQISASYGERTFRASKMLYISLFS